MIREFLNSPDEFHQFHKGIRDGFLTLRLKTKRRKVVEKFMDKEWEEKEAHYYLLGMAVGTSLQVVIAASCLYLANIFPKLYKLFPL